MNGSIKIFCLSISRFINNVRAYGFDKIALKLVSQ